MFNYNLTANFCIIRAVYRYMALTIQHMPNAMPRFYEYLGINKAEYYKLIDEGYGDIKLATKRLVSCGFSDTLFRKDSATHIKCSELLRDQTANYLESQRKAESKATESLHLIKNYASLVEAEIGYIRNVDNTLLVILVRRLIDAIYANSSTDDIVYDFADALNKLEYEGHILQKELSQDVIEYYKLFLEYKKNLQNNTV